MHSNIDMLIFGLLVTVGFIGITAILAIAERKRYGTWLTPTTALAGPMALVILLASILGPLMGYYPTSAFAIAMWMVAILVFGLIGVLIGLPLGKSQSILQLARSEDLQQSEVRAASWSMLLGAVVLVIILAAGVMATRSVGITAIIQSGQDLQTILSRGVVAHISMLRTCLVVVLLGTARGLFSRQVLLAALLIMTALVFSPKYHAIHPFVAAIFYRLLTRRTKVTAKLVLAVAIAGSLLFVLSYLFIFQLRNPDSLSSPDTYKFLFGNLVFYVISGLLGFGEIIRLNVQVPLTDGLVTVFLPFINLLNQVLHFHRGPLTGTGGLWLVVNQNGQASNVSTMLGMLVYSLGYVGALFYMAGLSLFVYGSYTAMLVLRNAWVVAGCAYILTMLAFAWFGFYFGLLSGIEVPAIFLLLFLADHLLLAWKNSKRKSMALVMTQNDF
jgi:oligosaccharide repeat unit polymerase